MRRRTLCVRRVAEVEDLARRDAQAAVRFDLRLDVAAETAVTFECCEDFEQDAADTGVAVTKSERGISVTLPTGAYLYTFTETKAGTILLTRHTLAPVA